MFLGADIVQKMIDEGVPARFKEDGSQVAPQNGESYKFDNENKTWIFPLIENLPKDHKIEGCSVDLRLDEVFEHQGGAVLLVEKRNTGDVIKMQPDAEAIYTLKSGRSYLVTTMEKVNMPNNLFGVLQSRGTLCKAGILFKSGVVNPNYYGNLTLIIFNATPTDIKIQKGFRFANLTFGQIIGNANAYIGNWQGGKPHTDGKFDPPR